MKMKMTRVSRASGKYDNIRRSIFCVTGIYEVKEKEFGTEKYLKT